MNARVVWATQSATVTLMYWLVCKGVYLWMGIIINAVRPRERQGCYFTALMTKHQWEWGADRGTCNNILLIWTRSTLWPLLHPVNLSDRAISPRAAAIYLIFSLEFDSWLHCAGFGSRTGGAGLLVWSMQAWSSCLHKAASHECGSII